MIASTRAITDLFLERVQLYVDQDSAKLSKAHRGFIHGREHACRAIASMLTDGTQQEALVKKLINLAGVDEELSVGAFRKKDVFWGNFHLGRYWEQMAAAIELRHA